jgi:hypothetical protein
MVSQPLPISPSTPPGLFGVSQACGRAYLLRGSESKKTTWRLPHRLNAGPGGSSPPTRPAQRNPEAQQEGDAVSIQGRPNASINSAAETLRGNSKYRFEDIQITHNVKSDVYATTH